MATEQPLQIDLYAILRQRLSPAKMRFVPRVLVSAVEKIIRKDDLNAILRTAWPRRGSSFSLSVLEQLGITADVEGWENVPLRGRHIFASNHPLGGLDGISLIAVIGEHYGDENIRCQVNDMLMNVEPLSDVFLPINKYGTQGRAAAVAMSQAYASDAQLIIFPAGLVSRRQKDGIRDLTWQKAFVVKAMEYDRDIVPVRFVGLNRRRFYNLAYWRKKSGLKINIEQAFLPAEVMASKGARFKIVFGKPVTAAELRESRRRPLEIAQDIKEMVYKL